MLDRILTPEQLIVISALSSGATMTEAAEEAGIHRNTIANWRRNQLPFQHALAEAQYDRALYYREQAEALVDQAFAAINQILADPKTPASVRLKAALALIQLATTPPPPKKQIELVFQSQPSQNLHNSAQPAPAAPKPPEPRRPVTQMQMPPIVHNSAQQPTRREHPKVGRNETCPCGSGQKYKRCCIDKHAASLANAA
jgi:transposase-like protein